MKQDLKLIIFDLDGTLVNAYRAVFQSLNYALKRSGFPLVDHETIRRSVGWGDRHLIELFVGPPRAKEVLEVYRRHHKNSLKTGTRFLPGARQVIVKLKKQGYRLAIASKRPTLFTEIILKYLKIRKYFDCVVCGDKVKRHKPAADILEVILKKFSFNKNEALYIGDMTIDAQTGKRAGVKTVIVLTGSSDYREVALLKPYKIIHHLKALSNIIWDINSN